MVRIKDHQDYTMRWIRAWWKRKKRDELQYQLFTTGKISTLGWDGNWYPDTLFGPNKLTKEEEADIRLELKKLK